MEIGNKILVTYSDGTQLKGRIYGETAKSWRVNFPDDQRTIRKTMTIEVIPENSVLKSEEKSESITTDPGKEPVAETKPTDKIEGEVFEPSEYIPSKKIKRNNIWILVSIFVIMAGIAAVVLFGTGIL